MSSAFARLAGYAARAFARVGAAAAPDGVCTMRDEFEYRYVASNPLLLSRARTLFTKEPETIRWIRSFGIDDVFVDIGANVGIYTIYAAQRCRRCYAFEPEAENFALLNRNIRLNGVAERVIAYPIALSDALKVDALRLSVVEPGAALHAFGCNLDFRHEAFTPAFMQGSIAVTLDNLVFEHGLEAPTHLKIDVDGLEAQVLRGAARTLRDTRLRSVLIEINENAPADVALLRELDGAGLRLADRGETITDTTGRARMANYIYTRG